MLRRSTRAVAFGLLLLFSLATPTESRAEEKNTLRYSLEKGDVLKYATDVTYTKTTSGRTDEVKAHYVISLKVSEVGAHGGESIGMVQVNFETVDFDVQNGGAKEKFSFKGGGADAVPAMAELRLYRFLAGKAFSFGWSFDTGMGYEIADMPGGKSFLSDMQRESGLEPESASTVGRAFVRTVELILRSLAPSLRQLGATPAGFREQDVYIEFGGPMVATTRPLGGQGSSGFELEGTTTSAGNTKCDSTDCIKFDRSFKAELPQRVAQFSVGKNEGSGHILYAAEKKLVVGTRLEQNLDLTSNDKNEGKVRLRFGIDSTLVSHEHQKK